MFELHLGEPLCEVIGIDKRSHEPVAPEVIGYVLKGFQIGQLAVMDGGRPEYIERIRVPLKLRAQTELHGSGGVEGAAQMFCTKRGLLKVVKGVKKQGQIPRSCRGVEPDSNRLTVALERARAVSDEAAFECVCLKRRHGPRI